MVLYLKQRQPMDLTDNTGLVFTFISINKTFHFLQLCCNPIPLLLLNNNFKINWDALGITASLACAIHCALLPLIFTSLPVFGFNIIENKVFEIIMVLVAFAVGIYSLFHGWKKHHHSLLPIMV